MRKLVVLGCGPFGQALLDCVKAISGLVPDEATFALDGSDVESFRRSFASICNSVYKNDSLLLADQINSPAACEALLVLEKKGLMHRMVLLGGANTSMLAAAMTMKETIVDDTQLVRVLRAEAASGIEAICLN